VLTVDLDRFGVRPGDTVLDLGCGEGRHAFALLRAGARVVALDRSEGDELPGVHAMFAGMEKEGEAPLGSGSLTIRGDALGLPFGDGAFDKVVASEILEHLPDDASAMAEVVRVLRPGGVAAVTVPRWLPEKVCWWLSDAYHEIEGGHVRIYRGDELRKRLGEAGLEPIGGHHAHALHAPYWWLRCAVGPHNDDHPATKLYHRLLVWDMMSRPAATRLAERALNPLIGKSLVLYLRKPESSSRAV
jgi:SAM-dependent methyltransferase